MTPIQKKYNISNRRAIELIRLFKESCPSLSILDLNSEKTIEIMKLTDKNEKDCIKEMINTYLKVN